MDGCALDSLQSLLTCSRFVRSLFTPGPIHSVLVSLRSELATLLLTLRPILSVGSFRVDLSHLTQHRLQHMDLFAIVGEPGAKRIKQFDGVFRDATTATDFDEFGGQFATFVVCVVVELQIVEDVLGLAVALLQFGVRHRKSRLGVTELSENIFNSYRVHTSPRSCVTDARLRLTLYTCIHSNLQPTFPYM